MTDNTRLDSSPERQRKVRIATGQICQCRKCYCCEEWLKAHDNGRSIVWGDNSTGYLCKVCGTDGLSFQFGVYPNDCPVCEPNTKN